MTRNKQYQPGAASLIIVMFTTILVGILTVSFVRMMIKDWESASEQDLSTSAYDSALAGVEDAKRALGIYNNKICLNNEELCSNLLNSHLKGENCDAIAVLQANANNATNVVDTSPEGQAETPVGGSTLNQAYTCVTINYDTEDYIGRFDSNNSDQVVIPIKATKDVSKIRLSWYQEEDKIVASSLSAPATNYTKTTPGSLPSYPARENSPDRNVPPIMSIQYFRLPPAPQGLNDYSIHYSTADHGTGYGSGSAYEAATTGEKSYYNTSFLLLYPTTNPTAGTITSFKDNHDLGPGSTENLVSNIKCTAAVTADNPYYCSAIISLPLEGGNAIPKLSSKHFLRLSRRYNTNSVTSYRIELLDSADTPVHFAGVQPIVDSNGRANDFMRRVQARIEPIGATDFPYPSAAIEVNGQGLIKDFGVTDTSCTKGSLSDLVNPCENN